MILAEGGRRGVAQIQGTVPDEFRAVFWGGCPRWIPGGFVLQGLSPVDPRWILQGLSPVDFAGTVPGGFRFIQSMLAIKSPW